MIYECEKCDCTEKEQSRGIDSAQKKENVVTTSSISRKYKIVNPLRKMRIEALASPKDFVDTVKVLYPKFDKTLESKCEHGDVYGVRLMADAERLLADTFGKRKADRHKLKYRLSARVTEEEYNEFQAYAEGLGLTVQVALRNIVGAFLKTFPRR